MRPANTTIVTLVSELARSLVGFFVTLYLARELGADILGTFFVVIALLVWLKLPLNAVGSAVTKRVSEGSEPTAYLGAGGILYFALTVVIAVGFLLLDGPVNAHIDAPVASIVAVLFIGNGFFSYVTNALDGQEQVATSSLLKAGSNIFEGLAQIAFVLLGYELFGLIGGQVVALLGGGLIGLLLFNFRPALPNRNHIESLIEYAKYSWLGTVSGRTFGWMDTLVLSFFVGSGLIGIYEISWRIASVLMLLGNAIQRTLFPEISSLAADGNESKIRFFIDEGLFYAGLIAIPGFVGAIVLGPKILRIYGSEFTAGASILVILVFARLLDAYGSFLLTAINGLDRPDLAFRVNGVFMASNLVLNVGLVYLFGWYGAAVATAVSGGLAAALAFYLLRGLVDEVKFPVIGMSKQILSSVTMAVVIVFGRDVVPITSMYHTVGYVFIGGGVYCLVILIVSERVRNKVRSLVPESYRSFV